MRQVGQWPQEKYEAAKCDAPPYGHNGFHKPGCGYSRGSASTDARNEADDRAEKGGAEQCTLSYHLRTTLQ